MEVLTDQLPIWIVKGSNWIAEYRLDKDDYLDENDKELPLFEQALESATKSIERIFPLWRPEPEDSNVNRDFGIENGVEFQMLNNEEPACGSFMVAFPKGKNENHNDVQYIASYFAFASAGHFEKAAGLKIQHDKDIEMAEAALRDLESPKKSKKPRSPKSPKKKK